MLKSHKNALLEVVQNSGLNPSLFGAEEVMLPKKRVAKSTQKENVTPTLNPATSRPKQSFLWRIFSLSGDTESKPPSNPAPPPVEEEKELCFVIRVRNTPLAFTVIPHTSNFDYYGIRYTEFKPGYPERSPFFSTTPFNKLLTAFKEWIENTVTPYLDEEKTPDLWQQVETYHSFIDEAPAESRDTSDFTEEEKADVRRSVEEFKRLVAENFSPTVEQQEYINRELDYLSNAVDRLNRFDWRGLAISTLMGIAINLSVDTERGRLLFKLFQQAFHAGLRLLQ